MRITPQTKQEEDTATAHVEKTLSNLSIQIKEVKETTVIVPSSISSLQASLLIDSPQSATGLISEDAKDQVLEKSFYTFDDFCFTFEAVFDDPEARAVFKTYVDKVSRSSELLLFSENVEQFKLLKSGVNRNKKAQEILDQFLKPLSKHEVNIGDVERQEVLVLATASLQEAVQRSVAVDIALFDKPLSIIMCLLQQDIFSRFVRSDMFRQFVSKKSIRYVLTLGALNEKGLQRNKSISTKQSLISTVSQKSKQIHLDIESEGNSIGKDDISVLMELAANPMDWKLLSSSQTSGSKELGYSSAFVSKSKYSFDANQSKGKRLFKAQGILPLSMADTASLLCNAQLKPLYENNLQQSQLLEFVHSKSDASFAESVVLENFPMTWPIYNRDFVVRNTVMHHAPTNEIIYLKKSTKVASVAERKGTIRGRQWMGWILSKVSETMTRYVHISYMDMQPASSTSSNSNGDKIWNLILSKRFKFLHGNLSKAVKQFSKKYNDTEGLYATLMENKTPLLKREDSSQGQLLLNAPQQQQQQQVLIELAKTDATKYAYHFATNQKLKRITYISKYATQVTDKDLEQIGKSAVSNNQLFHITGMLLCTNQVFYQVIEGLPQHIDYIYDKILKDPRHTDAKCVKEELDLTETDRQFPNWSMNTVNLDVQDHYFAEVIRKLIQQVSGSTKLTAKSAKIRSSEKTSVDEQNIVEEIIKANQVAKNIFENSSLTQGSSEKTNTSSSTSEYTETDGSVSDDEEEDQ